MFQNSSNPVNGTNPVATGLTGTWVFGASTNPGGTTLSANWGQRAFAYTAPSGFKALCDTNLGAPLVAKPNTLMDVLTWTGNSTYPRSITGLNFSPDLIWLKNRTSAYDNVLMDAIRDTGTTKWLSSNLPDAEGVDYANANVTSLDANGFTIGSTAGTDILNQSGTATVGWAWNAGGTTDPSNQAGSITSQVRANASAGFSVVTYTGTGATGTVGHGLGVAPSLIITKNRDRSVNWSVYHASSGKDNFLRLDTTNAQTATNVWDNTAPTSTVFSIGADNSVYPSGEKIVAYCFAPVVGYSSFGSYTGNGSADGPFVYTGFRPRWVMYKVYFGDTGHWFIHDTSRDPYNEAKYFLTANLSAEETTSIFYPLDILSNGFKIRSSNANINGSGYGFIYYAVAENPLQYARAR